jgi:hypothetical protein
VVVVPMSEAAAALTKAPSLGRGHWWVGRPSRQWRPGTRHTSAFRHRPGRSRSLAPPQAVSSIGLTTAPLRWGFSSCADGCVIRRRYQTHVFAARPVRWLLTGNLVVVLVCPLLAASRPLPKGNSRPDAEVRRSQKQTLKRVQAAVPMKATRCDGIALRAC